MGVDPEEWQLTGAAAGRYERFLVPAVTLPWANDLVQRVGLYRGDRVLDVACGSGAATRVAARRVEEPGHVVGLDINPGMLAVARSLTLPRGSAQIEWCEGSALALPFAEGVFDAVLCQLGLQFVPDRPAAVREMRRVLGRGGHVGASVYAPIDRNPATHALADALDRHLGAGASRAKRHEHSLGDPNELRALFAGAGFEDVRMEQEKREDVNESFDDYWEPIEAGVGSIPQAYLTLSEADRRSVREEVKARDYRGSNRKGAYL